jgi:phosphoglucosamine mutase
MGGLFGADGIRGLVNHRPLIAEDLERLGQVLGWILFQQEARPRVLMARDTRESGMAILRPLIFGLTRAGLNVVDVGILPTPGVSYLTRRFGFSAGIMISASHNPINENGIKLFDRYGHKLSEAAEAQIDAVFASDTILGFHPNWGAVQSDPGLRRFYAEALIAQVREVDWSQVAVIVDCAQGAASDIMADCVERLKVKSHLLNTAPDGTNANLTCGSEYARKNPNALARMLREQDWPIAVVFDGDADRVLFVDRTGLLYNGDDALAILALHLHDEHRLTHHTLATTPMRNTGLRDHLRHYGVQVKETDRNGDKFVVELMEREGYILGGEQVGHTVVLDGLHVTGDGIRTAWMILKLLAEHSDATLADLSGGMRKSPQVLGSAQVGREARGASADSIPGLADLQREAWAMLPGLIRLQARFASTEPVLRIMLESDGRSSVRELAVWARRIGMHVQTALHCTGYPIEVLDCTRGGLIVE